MTVDGLMRQAVADGIIFRIAAPEGLKVVGRPEAVQRWLPSLKPHKQQILDALLSSERQQIMRLMVNWHERAAMMTNASTIPERAELAAWHEMDLDAAFFGIQRLN